MKSVYLDSSSVLAETIIYMCYSSSKKKKKTPRSRFFDQNTYVVKIYLHWFFFKK